MTENPSELEDVETRTPARVLIVDDDPMVRQQVALVLRDAPVDIVGEAADGAAAIEQVTKLNPEIVLMDIRLPVMNGIEATQAICALPAPARVIALTALGEDDALMQMLRAGAQGFVPKEYASEELATAVHHVARGEGYVSPHSQLQLFGQLVRGADGGGQNEARTRLAALSAREREVARLVATGARTVDIARSLFVSESTIKSQLDSIRTKLTVSSREEIAVLVERAGADRSEN